MDQAEYDRKYRSRNPLPAEEVVSSSPAKAADQKPKITLVNSTAGDQYRQEMQRLAAAGADYEGREELIRALRRMT